MQTTAMTKNTTVVAATPPQLVRPDQLGHRLLGQLGHLCRRCCRYCGILFIAVICLMLYIIV